MIKNELTESEDFPSCRPSSGGPDAAWGLDWEPCSPPHTTADGYYQCYHHWKVKLEMVLTVISVSVYFPFLQLTSACGSTCFTQHSFMHEDIWRHLLYPYFLYQLLSQALFCLNIFFLDFFFLLSFKPFILPFISPPFSCFFLLIFFDVLLFMSHFYQTWNKKKISC